MQNIYIRILKTSNTSRKGTCAEADAEANGQHLPKIGQHSLGTSTFPTSVGSFQNSNVNVLH